MQVGHSRALSRVQWGAAAEEGKRLSKRSHEAGRSRPQPAVRLGGAADRAAGGAGGGAHRAGALRSARRTLPYRVSGTTGCAGAVRNLLLCIAAALPSRQRLLQRAPALGWRTASRGARTEPSSRYSLLPARVVDRRIENAGELIVGDVPLFTTGCQRCWWKPAHRRRTAFFLHQMRKTGGVQSVLAMLGYVIVGGTVVFGLSPNLAHACATSSERISCTAHGCGGAKLWHSLLVRWSAPRT